MNMCVKPDSSPLPWVVEKQACSRLYMLLDNMGSIVASNLTLEDAKLICHAVNTHTALVDALKLCVDRLPSDKIYRRREAYHFAVAALAAAKGEKA